MTDTEPQSNASGSNLVDAIDQHPLYLGAAYYPEQSLAQINPSNSVALAKLELHWQQDIYMMRALGLNVVRMGEFAWSTLEPAEGQFNFDWLDQVIQLCQGAKIACVLGTATAAPPAWLMQEYPELMAVQEDGRRVQFGNRAPYCVNASEMQSATHRLVGALAKHYGPNPNVIGWQIDNAVNRVCYCERCQKLFQQYLTDKYQTLTNLNARWATACLSQTYSAWEQIRLSSGGYNPGLRLEAKHFITRSYRQFQCLQIDLLRPHLRPGVWITHPFVNDLSDPGGSVDPGGLVDPYQLAEDVDLVSGDWSISAGRFDYLSTGAGSDLWRGLKRKNYWVMGDKTTAVSRNSRINPPLKQGEARARTWRAVAHGADGLLNWQWQTALNGQEQTHHSLVDQSGMPRPVYEEVRQIAIEFKRVSSLIVGTRVKARVAILNDYDSRWAIEGQYQHKTADPGEFDYRTHLLHYYRPFAALNLPVDIISAAATLEGYDLVIAPALLIVTETCARRLVDFVEQGGKLVIAARCGMKDSYNVLLPSRQPGPLAELAGAEVEEYYELAEPVGITGNWFEGNATIWAERLKITDQARTVVVARYQPCNGWLDDQPGITVHGRGAGLVYYVGTYLDEKSQLALLEYIAKIAMLKPLRTPAGIEVRTRLGADGKEVYFVLNHTQSDQTLWLPWLAHEHLADCDLQYELKLSPYGVAILTPIL